MAFNKKVARGFARPRKEDPWDKLKNPINYTRIEQDDEKLRLIMRMKEKFSNQHSEGTN